MQQSKGIFQSNLKTNEKNLALTEPQVEMFTELANKAGELENATTGIMKDLAAWSAPGLIKLIDELLEGEKLLKATWGKTFGKTDSGKVNSVFGKDVDKALTLDKGKYTKENYGASAIWKDIKGGYAGDILNFLSGDWVPKAGAATVSGGTNSSKPSWYYDKITNKRKMFYDPTGPINERQRNSDIHGVTFGNSQRGKNAQTLWKLFKDQGWSNHATSGILANLAHESGLNPKAANKIGAVGLAQWLDPSRKKQFLEKTGMDIKDAPLEIQGKFISDQLKDKNSGFKWIGDRLKNAKSAQEAAFDFGLGYETPQTKRGPLLEDIDARAASANEWEKQGTLRVEIDFKNLPVGLSANAKEKSSGIKIGKITQQRAMAPGSETF